MTTDPSPLPEGVTPADVLAEVRRCAAAWDSDACLVGNVRAGAIVVAIDRLAEEVKRLKAEREKAIQAVVDACEKHVGHVEAELAELRHEHNTTKPLDVPPVCGGCGGPHPFDTTIPSAVWNRIVRARGLSEYLCATCIVRVFAEAGEGFTAQLWSGGAGGFCGLPIELVVDGKTSTVAAEVSDENTILRGQLAAAEARVAELEKAYRTHASHTDDCDWYNDRSPEAIKSEWAGRCDCGMRAALAPPPPSEGATLLRADDAGGTDAGRR